MTQGVTNVVGASIAGVASRLGYRLWPAQQARESGFAEVIHRESVDVLLCVQSPYVLPGAVVTAPIIGSFNLHPGPLPRYAGLNAPSWAIFHGEQSHAVTLHWMDEGIDTGPVAYVAELPVHDDDTGLTLSARCTRAGLPLLHDLLAAAATQSVPRKPQPGGIRRYYGHEVPHDGRLIWSESARQLVDFIRACDYVPFLSPWRSPRAYLAGREILILKAGLTGEPSDVLPGTVGRRIGTEVLVAAGDQWVTIRRVGVGTSHFAAADALREGDRFALPAAPSPSHVLR